MVNPRKVGKHGVIRPANLYPKGGRPKIFTDEVLEKLAESLQKWVYKKYSEEGLALLSEWCFENRFSLKNLVYYTQKNPAFREAYEWAKALQEFKIAKGALLNEYNPRFAQFFLGCNHEWKTNVESDRSTQLRNDFDKFLEFMQQKKQAQEPEEDEDI